MQSEQPAQIRSSSSTLLQLHIAEYQALTTRNTYWITLQYFLWPILIGVVGLAVQAPNPFDPTLRIWAVAGAVQVVVVAYYASLLEQYSNVRYIESELKSLISTLVGADSFWGYERYLKGSRPFKPLFWEIWPLLLSLLFVGLPIARRWNLFFQLASLHWAAAVLDSALAVLAIMSAFKAIGLRRRFFDGTRAAGLPVR